MVNLCSAMTKIADVPIDDKVGTEGLGTASADVRFGQDENVHGRFPGGGSTIRFPREAGWANAMRYMLTGDHTGAEEAYRTGECAGR
jgi:Enoyl-CoA hydratase/isomerase